jgi:hypothetical protein
MVTIASDADSAKARKGASFRRTVVSSIIKDSVTDWLASLSHFSAHTDFTVYRPGVKNLNSTVCSCPRVDCGSLDVEVSALP